MENQRVAYQGKMVTMTERYVQKFGSVTVSCFQFAAPLKDSFISFQDSLQKALIRKEMVPAYLWLHYPQYQSYFLTLWTYGYTPADIMPVITRIGELHSEESFALLDSVLVTESNLSCMEEWFSSYLETLGIVSSSGWHQRSWAVSHGR